MQPDATGYYFEHGVYEEAPYYKLLRKEFYIWNFAGGWILSTALEVTDPGYWLNTPSELPPGTYTPEGTYTGTGTLTTDFP